MSHDWPRGIAQHGNVEELLRKKSFFREEVQTNTLGSTPSEQLIYRLQPKYWFAAHLHVKFAAVLVHPLPAAAPNVEKAGGLPWEAPPADVTAGPTTKFLALDKCELGRGRDFLQLVELPVPVPVGEAATVGEPTLCYDADWLAIVRATMPQVQSRNAHTTETSMKLTPCTHEH
jgi:lariat debranching enzyme